jgi:hypothetical protein
MSLVVSVVLLMAIGSSAAGSTAVAAEKAAMNSLPSRAAVQQELDRICSTNKTTHIVQAGERVQHPNSALPKGRLCQLGCQPGSAYSGGAKPANMTPVDIF